MNNLIYNRRFFKYGDSFKTNYTVNFYKKFRLIKKCMYKLNIIFLQTIIYINSFLFYFLEIVKSEESLHLERKLMNDYELNFFYKDNYNIIFNKSKNIVDNFILEYIEDAIGFFSKILSFYEFYLENITKFLFIIANNYATLSKI